MSTRVGASVVIPTRNRADLLALTLRSVLGQRDVDIEVIVIDDGDGPETAALVNAFDDARVRLIRNRAPRGECGARNCGVAIAQREWVAFCDDDDLWAPEKLSAQLVAAAHQGAAWVYTGYVEVDLRLRVLSGSSPPSPEEVLRDLDHHNSVPAGASNVVVKADALAAAGPFDTTLRTSGDWDQWLRLARTAGRPACVPRPFVALRIHPRMVSRRADWILNDIEVVAQRYGIAVDRARHHRWAAWMSLEDNRRGTALKHYAKAAAAGDWRSVGRAVVALLDRSIIQRRRQTADEPWTREAQLWLDALNASAVPSPDSVGVHRGD